MIRRCSITCRTLKNEPLFKKKIKKLKRRKNRFQFEICFASSTKTGCWIHLRTHVIESKTKI